MTTSTANGSENQNTSLIVGLSARPSPDTYDQRPGESWDYFILRKLREQRMETPDHLGGHLNKVHTDRGTLLYLIQKYNISSFLDIGCGPGWMVEIAKDRGLRALGIDGDFNLQEEWKNRYISVIEHDFTKGKIDTDITEYDLAWSVEFLEHVEEQYMPNYMDAFKRCKYAVVTAAPPGHGGHHHVNEQPIQYWIDKFAESGFRYDAKETQAIKEQSTMKKPFMQKNALFFVREE
jgi:SAM-dependent methyltransferase